MIVGFGHRKRVGKDTAAKFLYDHLAPLFPLRVRKAAFADKLKSIAADLYGWAGMQSGSYYETHPEARDAVLPAIGKTPRQILIDLGTPVIRKAVFDGTWVQYLLQNHKPDEILIISDVRFPNEADEIKNRGGIVVKIENHNVPVTHDVADDALDGWGGWDFRILNNTTLRDFRDQIEHLSDFVFEFVSKTKPHDFLERQPAFGEGQGVAK